MGDDSGEAGPDRAPVAVALRPEARRLLALLAAAGIVLWLGRGVLGPFVVAAVLAYAFNPLVTGAQRRFGVPRVVVVAAGYLIALLLLGILFALAAGPLARELEMLASAGPDSVSAALRQLLGTDTLTIGTRQITVAEVARQLQAGISGWFSSPGDALHLASVVGEVALQAVLTLIVAFYLLLDGGRFTDFCLRFLAPTHRRRAEEILERIQIVLGKWIRGQLLLIGLVAAVVYVVLGPVLHVRYALALGVLTGILEVLPLVGPLIAAALAAIIAASTGGVGLAVTVLVIYFVIRQLEDQIVMPIVIGRAVHLHPVVTIFAVLVGLNVWGVLGGLLAVPVAAALNVTLRELYPEARSTSGTTSETTSSEPSAETGLGIS